MSVKYQWCIFKVQNPPCNNFGSLVYFDLVGETWDNFHPACFIECNKNNSGVCYILKVGHLCTDGNVANLLTFGNIYIYFPYRLRLLYSWIHTRKFGVCYLNIWIKLRGGGVPYMINGHYDIVIQDMFFFWKHLRYEEEKHD